ncbi:MAG: hypothetical protein LBI48_09605 [Burkholderiaceae bacterium]|jgi:hypothetical protein|nr:hypothetical protein [Burkholderiaceae bacterium]
MNTLLTETDKASMSEATFDKLGATEQLKLNYMFRNGMTNQECLASIFGKQIPDNATSFHTSDGKAYFLDANSPDWHKPVSVIPLTDETRVALKKVGLLGSLGWLLEKSANAFSNMVLANHLGQ